MKVDLSQLAGRTPTKLDEEFFWEDGSSIKLSETEWDYKNYDAFVSVFTSRQLTAQSDALRACRGILNMIARNTGQDFVFGLPSKDLHRALLWKPHNENTIIRRHNFPSCSWLGWTGRREDAYWIGDMADYVNEEVPRPRKRLKGLEPIDAVSDISAEITYDHLFEMNHTQLRIKSQVAKFYLFHQRRDGDLHAGLKQNSVQPSHAISDHWTLVAGEGGTNRMWDRAGEHPIFENTDYLFRVRPCFSNLLYRFVAGQQEAEFLLIQRWPFIRDSKKSNKRRENLASALLIISNGDGTYWRLASVLVPWEKWQAAKPETRTIELV